MSMAHIFLYENLPDSCAKDFYKFHICKLLHMTKFLSWICTNFGKNKYAYIKSFTEISNWKLFISKLVTSPQNGITLVNMVLRNSVKCVKSGHNTNNKELLRGDERRGNLDDLPDLLEQMGTLTVMVVLGDPPIYWKRPIFRPY